MSKFGRPKILGFAIVLCLLGVSPKSWATPPLDVFEVTMNLQVAFGDEVGEVPVIRTTRLGNPQIINLALGQPLTNAVPANHVLAAIIPCGNPNIRIVVFNKATTNVVATLATTLDAEALATSNKVVFVTLMEVVDGPSLDGGALFLNGSGTVGATSCATRVSAKVGGFLVKTDEEPSTAIMTGGSLTTRGRPIVRNFVLLP